MLKTRLPALLLGCCLCLAPGLPRAEGLFIWDAPLPGEERSALHIAPVTSPGESDSPLPAGALAVRRHRDAQQAAALREKALSGDAAALFAVLALNWRDEEEQRPPLFGAPAAFWEGWAVRMMGVREAWFRLAVTCDAFRRADAASPGDAWERMTADALRVAAANGHAEAMFALAWFCEDFPDENFRLPEQPEFFILPRDTDETGSRTPEARYWMGAAAANGSARAAFYLGTAHEWEDFGITDAAKALDWYRKALRRGLGQAAVLLHARLSPFNKDTVPGEAGCPASIHYHILMLRMGGHGVGEASFMAECMQRGNHALFPTPCLTRKEYEDTLRATEKEYERIKADLLAKKKARSALYARAEPLFAALRAAYAAQAKGTTAADGRPFFLRRRALPLPIDRGVQ